MNLQLALIGIGILVVAGIYVYSRWQQKQSLQDSRELPAARPDGENHSEPSFDERFPRQLPEQQGSPQVPVIEEPEIDFDNRLVEEVAARSPEDRLPLDTRAALDAADEQAADAETRPMEDIRLDTLSDEGEWATQHDEGLDNNPDADQDDAVQAGQHVVENIQSPVLPRPEATEDAQDSAARTANPDAAEKVQQSAQSPDANVTDEPADETRDASENLSFEHSAVDHDTVADDAVADIEDDIPVLDSRVDFVAVDSYKDVPDLTIDSADESAPLQHASSDLNDDPKWSLNAADSDGDFSATGANYGPLSIDADETRAEIPERNVDMRDERSSLKHFLETFKPLNRIRDSLAHKLESVKAEREGTDIEENDNVGDKDSKTTAQQADLLDTTSGGLHDEVGDDRGEHPVDQPFDTVDASEDDANPAMDLRAERVTTESAADLQSQPQEPVAEPVYDGVIRSAPGFEKLSQIDYYVKLSGERDLSRDAVLAVYREAAADLTRMHSVYGLRLPDKVWRNLEQEPEESRFGDLVITIQLADQNGPVTEKDMTRFSSLVMKLSESTGRGFAFMAPIENAHQQAQAIDQFRQRYDSIFMINILPVEDDKFEGAVIDRCATQIGLSPDENNFYTREKPVGKQKVCLYSVANMTDTGEFEVGNMRGTSVAGVTFFTRPAINRSPGAVFSEMVDAAKAFASRVKGEAIAPGHDDLSTDDIESIRRSIEKVAREMESYGISPGGEEASRLF